MSHLKCDALIEVTARVRRLVTCAPGVRLMLREQMIGKWYVGETGKQVRIADNVEVADVNHVMTRSRVSVSRSMCRKFYILNKIGMVEK